MDVPKPPPRFSRREDDIPVPPKAPVIRPPEAPPEPPIKPMVKGPPLFIKVDRYAEIVTNIQSLKSYSLSLRDAIDALADIEAELKSGLAITQKALDKFNTTISLLDAKLLRIQGLEKSTAQAPVEGAEEIDSYVRGLYDQMERIKHDIKTIDIE